VVYEPTVVDPTAPLIPISLPRVYHDLLHPLRIYCPLLSFPLSLLIYTATYTIAHTPRQYLSHILRNRGCPPISQSFIVTFPLVTFLILKPTVGIESSLNCPDYKGESI
jgi:hypothetical protein